MIEDSLARIADALEKIAVDLIPPIPQTIVEPTPEPVPDPEPEPAPKKKAAKKAAPKPTPEPTPALTADEVNARLKVYANKGGDGALETILGVLAEYGGRLHDVDPENYQVILDTIEEKLGG